jgi:hypothetical protein
MVGKNKMEFEPQEQVIFDLLAKLKNANEGYPEKLMASRRQIYLSQIANIGLGIGLGEGIKHVTKTPKSGLASLHIPTFTASSLFETILLVAIVVEAGIAAYNYKDRIVEFFASISSTPTVENVAPIPVTGSSSPEIGVSETITVTATTPTVTPTTPSTVEQPVNGNTGNEHIATSTPNPTNDSNGNHYGQTPKPAQTKDKDNGSSEKSSKKQ